MLSEVMRGGEQALLCRVFVHRSHILTYAIHRSFLLPSDSWQCSRVKLIFSYEIFHTFAQRQVLDTKFQHADIYTFTRDSSLGSIQ